MIKFLKKKIIKKNFDWNSEYIKVTEMIVSGIYWYIIFEQAMAAALYELNISHEGEAFKLSLFLFTILQWFHSITYLFFYHKKKFWKRNLYNFILNPNIILALIAFGL